MPRSITNHEIALIKGMLRKGMANNKIQMYFNTMQRPVNSGRITGIKNGTYSNSKNINAASQEDVENFLKAKKFGHSGQPVKPTVMDVSDIKSLVSLLEGMAGHDNRNPGNYTILPLHESQLNIIRYALNITLEAEEIPKWSHSTVTFLKGVTAVLEELKGTIEQTTDTTKSAIVPLISMVNKVLSKLQKMLEALKFED